MTLEDLLRMKIEGKSPVTGEDIKYSPEFRVSVQKENAREVHIIIHADGHNSETLDFFVQGDRLIPLNNS